MDEKNYKSDTMQRQLMPEVILMQSLSNKGLVTEAKLQSNLSDVIFGMFDPPVALIIRWEN